MAYKTSQTTRQRIKFAVFDTIAPGETVRRWGREIYRMSGLNIHARYCAPGTEHYKFNLNPNTLRADFVLWICGSAEHWYLIPINVIRQMYDHPAAYPDNLHADIRVVTIDTQSQRVTYAAPGISLDLTPFFRATLGIG
ncbi:MAG: hypothetical protein ACYC3I_22140 [Gemmataceae bacterium]